jgi:hypothetical protein
LAGVIVALMFLIITAAMFSNAVYMVGVNITPPEERYPGENPYRSSFWENMHQVLGQPDRWLLLPVEPSGRPSGTSFPAKLGPKAAAGATLETAGGRLAEEGQAAGPGRNDGAPVRRAGDGPSYGAV